MKKLIILVVLLVISCGIKQKSESAIPKSAPEMERAPASVESEEMETVYESSESVEYEDAAIIVMEDVVEEIEHETSAGMVIEEPVIVFSESDDVIGDESEEFAREEIVEADPIVIEEDDQGRLVYEIPSEMTKFQTYTIEVRIAQDETDVSIVSGLQPTDDVIIRTSETMQVELVDPTGISFKIVDQSAKQIVEPNEFTTWIFYVTPLKKGTNYISIVVSIIKDGNLKQTVYKDVVTVETTPAIEVSTFVSKYWQWIIGFLVSVAIPFFIWVFKYLKKRKETS